MAFYLVLNRIECRCGDSHKATCTAIGAMQPKLDNKKVGEPVNINCPATRTFPPANSSSDSDASLRKLTSDDGRLHLHGKPANSNNPNRRLYEGTATISINEVANQPYEFIATSFGNSNCTMTLRYTVTDFNLVTLTRNFILNTFRLIVNFIREIFRFEFSQIGTLVTNFIRDLRDLTLNYIRDISLSIRLSFQELFTREDEGEEDPEEDVEDESDDDQPR